MRPDQFSNLLWFIYYVGRIKLTNNVSDGRDAMRVIKSRWDQMRMSEWYNWDNFEKALLLDDSAVGGDVWLMQQRAVRYFAGDVKEGG